MVGGEGILGGCELLDGGLGGDGMLGGCELLDGGLGGDGMLGGCGVLDGMLGGDGMLGVLLVGGGGDCLWHPERISMQRPSVT